MHPEDKKETVARDRWVHDVGGGAEPLQSALQIYRTFSNCSKKASAWGSRVCARADIANGVRCRAATAGSGIEITGTVH
jgi:hypothetical protein